MAQHRGTVATVVRDIDEVLDAFERDSVERGVAHAVAAYWPLLSAGRHRARRQTIEDELAHCAVVDLCVGTLERNTPREALVIEPAKRQYARLLLHTHDLDA